MQVAFGVKSSDIEEARVWVERATGLPSEARDNDSIGNYFAFGGLLGERLKLFENWDPRDSEPVHTRFANWKFLLFVERTNTASKALRGLENDPQHFVKLETRGA
jgi:hypothetical protein